MNRNDDLRDCLRALANTMPQEASPLIRQRLLTRFRERRDSKRRRAYVSAIVASVAIGIGFYLAMSLGHSGVHSVSATPEDRLSGFITLPYAQSGVPLEQPIIVRINIPVSELGMMGVPLTSAGNWERVRADLLVGQDGVARAVRFVE